MSPRDAIPIMELIKEKKEHNIPVICTKPYVYCKVFEDNSGALELARLPKLRPRTKHINVCYHHFWEHVRKGLIKIFPVGIFDQIANVLTKALAQNDFTRHCIQLCGKWFLKPPKWGSVTLSTYFGTYFIYLPLGKALQGPVTNVTLASVPKVLLNLYLRWNPTFHLCHPKKSQAVWHQIIRKSHCGAVPLHLERVKLINFL
jgi:hypothetical protein